GLVKTRSMPQYKSTARWRALTGATRIKQRSYLGTPQGPGIQGWFINNAGKGKPFTRRAVPASGVAGSELIIIRVGIALLDKRCRSNDPGIEVKNFLGPVIRDHNLVKLGVIDGVADDQLLSVAPKQLRIKPAVRPDI